MYIRYKVTGVILTERKVGLRTYVGSLAMERTIIEGNLIQVKKDTVSVGAQAFLWSSGFWGGTNLLESNYY